MTVSWKLSDEDLKKAVVHYLNEVFGIVVDEAKIKLSAWNDQTKVWTSTYAIKAEAIGEVNEGVSLGPYR